MAMPDYSGLTVEQLYEKLKYNQTQVNRRKKEGKPAPNYQARVDSITKFLGEKGESPEDIKETTSKWEADAKVESALGEGVVETAEAMFESAGGEEAYRHLPTETPPEIQEFIDKLKEGIELSEEDKEIIQMFKDSLPRTEEMKAVIAAARDSAERTPEEQISLDMLMGKTVRTPEQQEALAKLRADAERSEEIKDLIGRYDTLSKEGLSAEEFTAEREQLNRALTSDYKTSQYELAKAQARGKVYGAASAAQHHNLELSNAIARGDIEQALFLKSANLKRTTLDKLAEILQDAEQFEREGLDTYQARLAAVEKFEGDMTAAYADAVSIQQNRIDDAIGQWGDAVGVAEAADVERLVHYGNAVTGMENRVQEGLEAWGGALTDAEENRRLALEFNVGQDQGKTATILGAETGLAALQASREHSQGILEIANNMLTDAGGTAPDTEGGGGSGGGKTGGGKAGGGTSGGTGGAETPTPTRTEASPEYIEGLKGKSLDELLAMKNREQAEITAKGGDAPIRQSRVRAIDAEIAGRGGGGEAPATSSPTPSPTPGPTPGPTPEATPTPTTEGSPYPGKTEQELMAMREDTIRRIKAKGGKANAPNLVARLADIDKALNMLRR